LDTVDCKVALFVVHLYQAFQRLIFQGSLERVIVKSGKENQGSLVWCVIYIKCNSQCLHETTLLK